MRQKEEQEGVGVAFTNILSFVKKEWENDDVYTFYFSSKKTIEQKAGQHGLFLVPGLYRPHPFTLSSSPSEEYIAFSTHVATGSRYKQYLMKMGVGDKILLIGPTGGFSFANNVKSCTFLAQGIGITPFRSMLVYTHTRKPSIITTLIHVDDKNHIFRHLTEKYATYAHYPTNPDEFRRMVRQQNHNQLFYLSGSPRFVSATRQLLKELDVETANIKTDTFWDINKEGIMEKISKFIMLFIGGLFTGTMLTVAVTKISTWQDMEVLSFIADFKQTVVTVDILQPIFLITTLIAVAVFFFRTSGKRRVFAGLAAGGLIVTLVLSLAVLVPLQNEIIAGQPLVEIEAMRSTWVQGHIGRTILSLFIFASIVLSTIVTGANSKKSIQK